MEIKLKISRTAGIYPGTSKWLLSELKDCSLKIGKTKTNHLAIFLCKNDKSEALAVFNYHREGAVDAAAFDDWNPSCFGVTLTDSASRIFANLVEQAKAVLEDELNQECSYSLKIEREEENRGN